MTEQPHYWFRAKRYGWGWGAPCSWQGWTTLLLFPLLMTVGSFLFPPDTHTAEFIGMVVILASALFGVCLAKGEPARWRWGDDDK